MKTIIYHNPKCETSRNVLAFIREKGIEPEIILYLENPLSRAELVELVKSLNSPIREIMRQKEAIYAELKLDDPKWSFDELIDFMMVHPILLNRPVVVTPNAVKLCRPSEEVLELLK